MNIELLKQQVEIVNNALTLVDVSAEQQHQQVFTAFYTLSRFLQAEYPSLSDEEILQELSKNKTEVKLSINNHSLFTLYENIAEQHALEKKKFAETDPNLAEIAKDLHFGIKAFTVVADEDNNYDQENLSEKEKNKREKSIKEQIILFVNTKVDKTEKLYNLIKKFVEIPEEKKQELLSALYELGIFLQNEYPNENPNSILQKIITDFPALKKVENVNKYVILGIYAKQVDSIEDDALKPTATVYSIAIRTLLTFITDNNNQASGISMELPSLKDTCYKKVFLVNDINNNLSKISSAINEKNVEKFFEALSEFRETLYKYYGRNKSSEGFNKELAKMKQELQPITVKIEAYDFAEKVINHVNEYSFSSENSACKMEIECIMKVWMHATGTNEVSKDKIEEKTKSLTMTSQILQTIRSLWETKEETKISTEDSKLKEEVEGCIETKVFELMQADLEKLVKLVEKIQAVEEKINNLLKETSESSVSNAHLEKFARKVKEIHEGYKKIKIAKNCPDIKDCLDECLNALKNIEEESSKLILSSRRIRYEKELHMYKVRSIVIDELKSFKEIDQKLDLSTIDKSNKKFAEDLSSIKERDEITNLKRKMNKVAKKFARLHKTSISYSAKQMLEEITDGIKKINHDHGNQYKSLHEVKEAYAQVFCSAYKYLPPEHEIKKDDVRTFRKIQQLLINAIELIKQIVPTTTKTGRACCMVLYAFKTKLTNVENVANKEVSNSYMHVNSKINDIKEKYFPTAENTSLARIH